MNKFRMLSILVALALLFGVAYASPAVAGALHAPPGTGDLYALDDSGDLYLLDKATGAPTLLASTGESNLSGLAIHPTTGKFYSAYTGGPQTGIVEIDPDTGAVTGIGGQHHHRSLTFDSSGQLWSAHSYSYWIGYGLLLYKSLSGGYWHELHVTNVTPTSGLAQLAYDSSTNKIYYLDDLYGQLLTIEPPNSYMQVGTVSGISTNAPTIVFIGEFYTVRSTNVPTFAFDENGNVYYHSGQPSITDGRLAFAESSDILTATDIGPTGLTVVGLAYQPGLANQPPVANSGGPYSGDEGVEIAMSGATASDPDVGDMLTYAWTVDSASCSFDNASVLNPNLTCSDSGSYTATLTVNDGVNPDVSSDASVTVNLNSFNGPNGRLGSNWKGAKGKYRIVDNQVDVRGDGALYWKHPYDVNQEVHVTLTTIDPAAEEIDLLLKVQGGNKPNWGGGVIEVLYHPSSNSVTVWTYRPDTLQWFDYPAIPAAFADGDQFGAQALASGDVVIFKNGVEIGRVTMTTADQNFFNPRGGYIGLWFIGATDSFFDDFGGGTVTP